MSHFVALPPGIQEPVEGVPFHEWVLPDESPWTQFFRTGTGYLLRFPGLADFLMSDDGSEVHCRAVPDLDDVSTQHLYLNQVLPLRLSKSGKLVFHASVIEAEGGAIAFAAESGRGKSTLAASFASNGFRFLTDDGLVLEECAQGYLAQPSHASVRLWRDSQVALISEDAELAPPVAFTPKARILSGAELAHCNEPRPLRRVYFLGDGSAEQIIIRGLEPSEALIGLVKHSFLMDLDQRDVLARHFDQLTRMVAAPIFFHLDYPRRYEALADVRRAIIEHATMVGEAA